MTQADLTSITLILDRSSSMSPMRAETINGINEFITDQRKQPGKALFGLVQFNSEVVITHDSIPLENVAPLTSTSYQPSGFTALLDAVGETIDRLGRTFAALPEDRRPGRVLLVIMTDGQENASKRYNLAQITAMIKEQRERYNWEVLFLGANQDAINVAGTMGIAMDKALTYQAHEAGMRVMLNSVSEVASTYRTGRKAGFAPEVRYRNSAAAFHPKAPSSDSSGPKT